MSSPLRSGSRPAGSGSPAGSSEGGPAAGQRRAPARRSDVPPFHVMAVMRAAGEREAAGHGVLHLEVGQPSTPAPAVARRAAAAVLEHTPLHYTDAEGTVSLRERIARWYAERHGLAVDPERVVVTTGASGACVLAFLVAFDVGARVGVAQPGYPCYPTMLTSLGCEPVPLEVDERTRFQPHPTHLAAAGHLDGLVVASPSNPTGTVLDTDALTALAQWCNDAGAWLVVDEIYHGITYGTSAPSVLEVDESAIVVNSFSKYFSMPGWRLGWLVVPDALVDPVRRLAQNLTVAPPTLAQVAGLAAMDATDELDAHVARYATNRSLVLDGLRRCGATRVAPSDGAFYAWAEVSHLTDDAQALCARWLDELGVAVTPGIDFDPDGGHRWVRLSYAGATEDVTEAMERLVHWCTTER
ncbi:MAG: aminotransferase class I/II-fold pyridoxal phosphate-dependent enzyme [Acidimicrobiia bacterium]|nr:aminotransferase class I/II-fold pyridoxal phosphate-dependent enzyme [Acidimicrobiia bacterium]